MKVLHVIDSGGLYGAEIMLLNLAREQTLLGLDPIIASIGDLGILEKPLESEARKRGLRVETFRMRPGPNILGALELVRFARHEGVDLLHSHGYKGNILLGMMPRALRKMPLVATLHGWTSTGELDRMRLYEWLDARCLNLIDTVVIVHEAMRAKVRPHPNLRVIENGIALPTPGKGGDIPSDADLVSFCRKGFTIGAIGRLSPEKGYIFLLQAMQQLLPIRPDVRLVVLGEGKQRSFLEAQAEQLGIRERVRLPGYTENARSYLPLFHLFVLCSLTEGLPLTILEAMLAETPIVATAVGGVPEVLEGGKAGILVAPGDATALARGVATVINEPQLRARLAAQAKRSVLERYSSRRMAELYLKMYGELLPTMIDQVRSFC